MASEIFEAFAQLAKLKNIDKDILESVLKDALKKMMEKRFGQDSEFEIIVNMDRGIIELFVYKTIVEEVNDPDTEIDLETARAKSDGQEFEIGEKFLEEITIGSFGRRSVQTLKQYLRQKISEIDKEVTYNRYKDQVGELIVAEVYQNKSNSILLMHNGCEIIFPKSEQIPKEKYKKGDTVRAVIKSVEKKSSGPPLIVVSRTDDKFLEKLFETEIPEIFDGVIEIKAIARDPGERAKVAVVSNDNRIDAVGACVGMRGTRIHAIVRELSNENIDVINYTDDIALYITRALAPAKIQEIQIDNVNKIAKIKADEEQISLLIGKNGQNIKLASRLTGYQLDVLRDENEMDSNEYEELTKDNEN
ncbi:MAG: transcription termination factor NusA [Ignavibacteria bacterium]|nr:transcription termination factor NusA [Ignavibacteria bacterium]